MYKEDKHMYIYNQLWSLNGMTLQSIVLYICDPYILEQDSQVI